MRLVGEAACPRSEIANDLVVHGAALDASGHLVLCPQSGRRPNLEARQILAQMRAVCRFLRDELPGPRLKLRNVVGPDAEGLIASAGTNTWIPEDVVFPAADTSRNKVIFRYEVRVDSPSRGKPRGRCWDVIEARDGWSGLDLAHPPSDLSTWWRCCCKVHMIAKRDSDVPTICQASPRGVLTKAIYEADLRFNRAQGGNGRGDWP